MKLLLKIRYIGTAYAGWQFQHNAPTVQGELTRACRELFGFPCDVTGCSRTDAGVHALCFCATVEQKGTDCIDTAIPLDKLPFALNNRLPGDISVTSAEWRPADFHARYSVRGKTYIYRFLISRQPDPFEAGRAAFCPRPMPDGYLERMNACAAAFVGRHDFTSFMASGSKIVDATRTVASASVTAGEDVLTFRVTADGFLYNMVRIMAGPLLDAAYDKLGPADIGRILDARNRHLAGPTLPPEGLYLAEVDYGCPVESGEESKFLSSHSEKN